MTAVSVWPVSLPEAQARPFVPGSATIFRLGSAASLNLTVMNFGDAWLLGNVSESCEDFALELGAGFFALAPGEIPAMTATLQRVLGEVGAR